MPANLAFPLAFSSVQTGSNIAASSISVGASPFLYVNNANYDMDVQVSAGTVTLVELVRNSVSTAFSLVAGSFRVSPGDGLRVTYSIAPTMTQIPR